MGLDSIRSAKVRERNPQSAMLFYEWVWDCEVLTCHSEQSEESCGGASVLLRAVRVLLCSTVPFYGTVILQLRFPSGRHFLSRKKVPKEAPFFGEIY